MPFSIGTIIWREIWQRKSRLVSGLMAIALGIAVITGIQTVTTVSRQVVAEKLDLLGANILVLPQAASLDDYYSADIDAPTFPEDYVERVATSMLPGVDNMSPKLSRRVKIGTESIILTGILPVNELASKPIWQASGLMAAELDLACATATAAGAPAAATTPIDPAKKRPVIDSLAAAEAWVGSVAAQRLGLTAGQVVTVEGEPFTVTHILPETGTIDDSRVFVHLHTAQRVLGTGTQISAIEIMGCCSAISDGLLAKLRNILPDTRITTISHIVNTQIETNRLMAKVSVIMLVIIVLVGAISIGNYMWANVEERRREMGTLITIGFKKRHIYRLFFVKSLVLGVIGGASGYLLGTGAALILGPQLAGLQVSPVFSLFVWSLVVAVGIAVVGSWYPTYRAARMDPALIMQEQ
ncbi:MAG: ABC transporter permease [candidate division Zixibacteria bacterium]|nr:ABC transporter permease [candidate division Zixibacteria bacterium]